MQEVPTSECMYLFDKKPTWLAGCVLSHNNCSNERQDHFGECVCGSRPKSRSASYEERSPEAALRGGEPHGLGGRVAVGPTRDAMAHVPPG